MRVMQQMLVGMLLLLLMSCEARRPPPPRREVGSAHQVTEPAKLDDGGWRPVIDSRISYELPQGPQASSSDQIMDLVPPPVHGPKGSSKGSKPRKPSSHKGSDLSGSETRGPTASDGPTGPSRPMRFPEASSNTKPRTSVGRRRPAHHHHHHGKDHHHHSTDHHHHSTDHHHHHSSDHHPHFHLRQNSYIASESTQQLRFRPSPPAPVENNNNFPGWAVQQGAEQQQHPVFYSPELVQQQQQFSSPNAQYHIALPQSPLDEVQYQQGVPASAFQASPPTQPTLTAQNAFIPGTTTVFGNAGLFNINPDIHKNQHLFLSPSAVTEPSVQENEVPEGPTVFVSQTTRARPVRPKYPITEPPLTQQQDNTDYRPRRPRPPSGTQAQLEITHIPDDILRVPVEPVDGPNNFTPRHPRPPSTEPPSWSHPTLENRPRKPRPPPQPIEEPTRNRRPNRPSHDIEPRKPILRPSMEDQNWKPSTPLPEPPQHLRPQEGTDEPFRGRRPRPPAPVQEQVEDDVERPVFNLRPRRPVPTREPEDEPATTRPSRIRSRPTTEQAQEDVDENVNVHPGKPEEEEKRTRRPKPPQDTRRRRPRPPVVEEPEEEELATPQIQDTLRIPSDDVQDVERPRRRPAQDHSVPQAQDVSQVEEKPRRRPDLHTVSHDAEVEVRPVRRRPSPEHTLLQDTEMQDKPPRRRPTQEQDFNHDENVPEVEIEERPVERRRPTVQATTEEEQSYVIAEQHDFVHVTEAVVLETSTLPPTTQAPAIPPKRRRPVQTEAEEENYPARVTTEAATTPVPTTTTSAPTTTRSLINSRLRARLNATRPRFSVGFKERLNKLSSNKNEESTTPATVPAEDSQRTRPRTRDSSRFRLTTEQPETSERTSFKPIGRNRPGSKFYSRYRTSTEEPFTTTPSQDATRRTSDDIFSIRKRRPFPLKSRNNEQSEAVTSMSFSVSEVTTVLPEEVNTTPEENTTEFITTTPLPEEPVPTTQAEDFSLAKRVTDLTSSATAFKPLSFFSAVPADGKSRSQLSSRFTMATEDPILPLEAFFPTFPSSKSSKEESD